MDKSDFMSPRIVASSVRTCSSCYTTKTPLWRTGPLGRQSLCNACGIRRIRKARKAMEAARVPLMNEEKMKMEDVKNTQENPQEPESMIVPCKKRFKFLSLGELDECSGDLVGQKSISMPSEEVRDAAILLMRLSSGHHFN